MHDESDTIPYVLNKAARRIKARSRHLWVGWVIYLIECMDDGKPFEEQLRSLLYQLEHRLKFGDW